MANTITIKIGPSFFVALFVILLVLKLCNLITCSWWIVTLPLWIFPAIFIGFTIVCFVFVFTVLLMAFLADFF